MMKIWPRAIVWAVVTEVTCLVILLRFARGGMCSPGNFLDHLFQAYLRPAFYVCELLHVPDAWSWLVVILLQTACWTGVWFGILKLAVRLRSKRG